MYSKRTVQPDRKGMILIVVLAILTLFAILGITFVLYSESAALAARYSSEGTSLYTPDMDPYECFSFFMGQFLYDVDDSDVNGTTSALRGLSLARNMYGWSSTATGSMFGSTTPFNGVGRLHFKYNSSIDSSAQPINGIDDWQLVNYTRFGTLDGTLLRDPEYFGTRAAASSTTWGGGAPGHYYVGGANPSYTYPDQNNLFLGAVQGSTGNVIAHSYHRDYTGFGTLAPGNLNWTWPSNPTAAGSGYPSPATILSSNTSQVSVPGSPAAYNSTNQPLPQYSSLKYMVLRPRPADHKGFPYPEDAGGDVKNLPFSPGYYDATTSTPCFNDSFWMDIGAPVQTAPDGRKYKMLVAPFIMDLDGKIDINAVGNIRGITQTANSPDSPPGTQSVQQNFTHMSNMGFGPWEINPYLVLSGSNDPNNYNPAGLPPNGNAPLATWTNLFTGFNGTDALTSAPVVQGKYGPPIAPATVTGLPYWTSGNLASPGRSPHYYSPVDYDGCANYVNSGTGTITFGQNSAVIPIPAQKIAFPQQFFATATGVTGYDNGNINERTDHPSLYDAFNPYNDPSSYNAYNNPTYPAYSSTTSIYNHRFNPAHLERLLRFGDTGYTSLPSDLERLTVENFNFYNFYAQQTGNTPIWDGMTFVSGAYSSVQRRLLVTTNSADRIAPGLTPYIFNPSTSGYAYSTTNYTLAPYGPSIPYPTLSYGTVPTSPPQLTTGPPQIIPGEFGLTSPTTSAVDYRTQTLYTWAGKTIDWQSSGPPGYTGYQWPPSPAQLQTALSRINLNRPLTPYPLYDGPPVQSPGLGASPGWRNPQSGSTYNTVFNSTTNPTAWNAFQEAQGDRQKLADDIYRRLLIVTGVPPVQTAGGFGPGNPSPTDLAPRRALAQLAVNIVDYIDEDDIMTPFNFYNNSDDPTGSVNIYATDNPASPGAPATNELPRYWVFGTELPKVVLNEVSAQCENGKNNDNTPQGVGTPPFNVGVWVELFNVTGRQTIPTTAQGQVQDLFPIPLVYGDGVVTPFYAPYQIVIGASTATGGLYQDPTVGLSGNPTGICVNLRKATDPNADFVPTNAQLFVQKSNPIAQPTATLAPSSVAATLQPPYIGLNTASATTGPGLTNSNLAYTYSTTGTQPALTVTTTTAATNPNAFNVPLTPFYVVGPKGLVNTTLFADPLETGATTVPTVPTNTPMLRTTNMTYATSNTGFGSPDDRANGLVVLLRRLANPHLQWNSTPGPNWNPYITVDYMDNVPILGVYGTGSPPNGYSLTSRGKVQPYTGITQIAPGQALFNSPVFTVLNSSLTQNQAQPGSPPNTPDSNGLAHTFGQPNNTTALGVTQTPYQWLLHLDRQVVSPLELLHVSAYSPSLLTQNFVNPTAAMKAYNHTAPWFEQLPATGLYPPATANNSYRLYRLFEFLDTGNRGAGIAPSGRAAGKININTIWDKQTFEALCDGNTSNHVNSVGAVDNVWNAFVLGESTTPGQFNALGFGRTPYTYPALPSDIDVTAVGTANIPSYYLSGSSFSSTASNYAYTGNTYKYDRPVQGLATGTTNGYLMGGSGAQFPNNRGIDDTLLRTFATGTTSGRCLQNQSDYGTTTHPFLQYQLLAKIFNNVTTRSNVYAVFLTVGFFQVMDDTTTPPTLGAEIGKAEGRNVRHRMFAMVDRTNLAAFQCTSSATIALTNQDATAGAPTGADPNGGQAIYRTTDISTVLGATPTDSRNGNILTYAPGMSFVFEPGSDNEETVVTYATAASGGGTFGAEFHKAHATGVPVIIRGNPGPWKRYDPRLDGNVVLHWNIIN
jgi:hypothetical protein